MCVCVRARACVRVCVCVCERDVTGSNEAKVGNIYFELEAKNDMEVIFWQIWGFCAY